MRNAIFSIAALALCVSYAVCQTDAKAQKLTAEDVIAKHIASIGTPASISAAKTRVLLGTTDVNTRRMVLTGDRTGTIQLAFDGNKFLVATVFTDEKIPVEKYAFDGKDLSFGKLRFSNMILDFVKANKFIAKRGFFGGVLNSGWVLTNPQNGASFEYEGQTKEGLHKLKVVLSDSEGAIVSLYFDPFTFRHVRTEYRWSSSGLMTRSPSASSSGPSSLSSERGAQPRHFILTESFSNFAKAGELNLPLSYTIEFDVQSEAWIWSNNIKEVYFNEVLDASLFKIS